jgi:hypothetical protein
MAALALRLIVPVISVAALAVIQVDIDRTAIDEAAAIARDRRGNAAARFHARYIDLPGGAKVARLEVVTEFRRAVLFAEARIQQGDFTWTASNIERALAPHRGRLTIVLEMRLPPVNILARPPAYAAALSRRADGSDVGPKAGGIRPIDAQTSPIFPPGLSQPGTPMQGARVELDFDARALDPNGRYALIVFEDEARLDPMTIDLSRYR